MVVSIVQQPKLLEKTGTLVRDPEDSVDFVESLLRRQLSACIGRSLTAADVANYMRFHHRWLGLGFQFFHVFPRHQTAGWGIRLAATNPCHRMWLAGISPHLVRWVSQLQNLHFVRGFHMPGFIMGGINISKFQLKFGVFTKGYQSLGPWHFRMT